MLKLLLILFTALFFQACQVKEQVATSNQVAPSYFPGATLTTVLPQNGWKKLGDNLDISLLFPLPITVGNLPYKPYIEAVIGPNVRKFFYEPLVSGTTTLIFRYTVVASDLDTDGISFGTSVVLNNATMTFSPAVSLVENVPTALTISNSDIKVDGIKPTLSSIATPVSGIYTTGQDMIYNVTCSEAVYVAGSPYFNVYLYSATVPAVYKSGSGTNILEFSHVIQATDADTNGIGSGTSLFINSGLGETIVDQAGNTLSTTITNTTTSTVMVNPTQPTITSIVATSANNTYTVTQNINFTVTMSQAVTVTGTPAIPVVLSTGTVLANYLNGSGTNTLLFRYVVQTNHADTDGIALQSPMLLNGATIKATSPGNADAALIYTIPSTSGILVDAATGPFVLSTLVNSSSVPANGFYIEGQNLNFTLNFSAAVNVLPLVGPKPRIPIIVGTTTVYADYILGSGTTALVFRYTPTTSQEDLDGISLLGPIDLNTGTIKDASNKPAILTFAPMNTSSIYVDGTSPIVGLVSSSSVGTFTQGTSLNFAVKFSEAVSITVNPVLSITVGSTARSASYVSGDGTDTLNFQYTIQAGESDTNGIDVNSFTTGTIQDLRAHTASLAFAPVNFLGAIVDSSAAGISSITPPANMTYKIGANLDFTVNWSEPTFVSGTPTLGLLIGATPKNATYVSSPTSMTSIFRYTVATGDLDTNGINTTTMQLSGGHIRDAAGNNSNLAFTAPVLTGVKVDGVIPFATITAPADGNYGAGQNLDFTLTWSEPITIVGSPYLQLTIGSSPVNAIKISAGASSAVFRYKVLPNQLDTNGISMLSAIFLNSGVTITDLAGNNSYLQIEPPVLTGVKVDAIAPMISGVLPPVSGTYLYKDKIEFTVLWSEAVTISGSPRIGIRIGTKNYKAKYAGPGPITNTSIFSYTVGDGDGLSPLLTHTEDESDANGITITSNLLDGSGNIINSYIELNSGTIKDDANNVANVNFLAPALTGVLVDGITAIVDPANPITTTMTAGVYCPPATATVNCVGTTLSFTIHWTKDILVDDSSGTPSIRVNVGGSNKSAEYISGSTTKDLLFSYTVVNGDLDDNGVTVNSQTVALNGGQLLYAYTVPFFPIFIDAARDLVPLSTFNASLSGINVDAVGPTRSSIISTNSIFRPGDNIDYSLTFNEPVTVSGTPILPLIVGSLSTAAVYISGSPTTSLIFRYTVPAGNSVLDIDGIRVSSTLILPVFTTIKDAYGNTFANATQTFPEIDYVYFSNTLARYKASSNTTNTLATCSNCVTNILDTSGNSNHLIPAAGAYGPQFISGGFASGASPYLKFNKSSMLKTTTSMTIKYVVFVMRTVDSYLLPETIAISYHRLLQRYSSTTYTPAIEFTSNSIAKSILFNPDQKLKINDTLDFAATYEASVSSASLWATATPYIMIFELEDATIFDPGSYFGGMDFNGQIAEIILLDGSATLSEINLETIRDQLNTIHEVFN